MPRPPPDPEIVAVAMQLVRDGASFRDVAEAVGVTDKTVRDWAKRQGVRSVAAVTPTPNETPAHMRPAAPPRETKPLATDLASMFRELIEEQRVVLEEARGVGNSRAVSQASSAIERFTKSLKHVEAERKDAQDTLHLPRQVVDDARRAVEARLRAIAERPLLCAHCSRALSIKFGQGEGGEGGGTSPAA